MNVVFLAIDGLQAAALGCYGNASATTPAIDRLACESLLCDFALSDAPTVDAAYQAWLHGRHAIEAAPAGPAWLQDWCAAGHAVAWLSDSAAAAEAAWSAQFPERICVPPDQDDPPADELENTALAGLAAAAGAWLARQSGPFCAWLHVGSLTERWDAPLELRERLRDEEDPPVFEGTVPPCAELHGPAAADERWRLAQAYAAQVSVVDWFVGEVLMALRTLPGADETLVVLTSPRGFPLGEHGRFGLADGAPFAELVHVPLLVRFPHGAGRLRRTAHLVQPCDLAATLATLQGVARGEPSGFARSLRELTRSEHLAWREAAVVQHGGWMGLRTRSWYWLAPAGEAAGPQPQLFAKPDDRRELNEIASCCGEVCAALQAELDRRLAAGRTGDFSALPPLGDLLTAPH